MKRAGLAGFVFFFVLVKFLDAQELDKLLVAPNVDTLSSKRNYYYVKTRGQKELGDFLSAKKIHTNTYKVYSSWSDLKKLQKELDIVYVQNANRIPTVESTIRQHNLGINGIWATHNRYPSLRGMGMALGIKENSFNIEDPDIAERAVVDEFSSTDIDRHATEMATLSAGTGNTFLTGRGVASEVNLYSSTFLNLMPEPKEYYEIRGISVQNHSYGVNIENFYGVESVAYDQLAQDLPTLLHSFSIGNDGLLDGSGTYSEINSYGTITGSFKQSKNVLLSTSSDSLGNIINFNSRGPAYDGRIKPDLVAFGGEGTSESAALISGGAVLIQERYKDETGNMPTSDLVRALLIAGANDVMEKGPDFISGYGSYNLLRSLRLVDSLWYWQFSVQEGEAMTLDISIPPKTSEAKFVLVWNDLPAEEGAEKALVNDLDLQIEQDEEVYFPWILDSSPSLNALGQPATKGHDRLNNVEVVSLENVSGPFTIRVSGFDAIGSQSFSLAYVFIPENHFEFSYPNASDPIESGTNLRVYWDTNIPFGNIEIRYNEEDNWRQLTEAYDLSSKQFSFQLEKDFELAQLRLVTMDSVYYSDVFQLSNSLDLSVDLNCDDKMILKWNDQLNATYNVKVFDGKSLNLISTISDTLFKYEKTTDANSFFMVQPIREDKKLLPSFLINTEQQNVGCYINSFLLDAGRNEIELRIGLSGLSEIANVRILRFDSDGEVQVVQEISDPEASETVRDQGFTNGLNVYTVEVETIEGSIFSSTIQIFNTRNAHIPFPSIVTSGSFDLLSPESGGVLELINSQGILVKTQEIVSELEVIDVSILPHGIYHYRVVVDGIKVGKGKILIR